MAGPYGCGSVQLLTIEELLEDILALLPAGGVQPLLTDGAGTTYNPATPAIDIGGGSGIDYTAIFHLDLTGAFQIDSAAFNLTIDDHLFELTSVNGASNRNSSFIFNTTFSDAVVLARSFDNDQEGRLQANIERALMRTLHIGLDVEGRVDTFFDLVRIKTGDRATSIPGVEFLIEQDEINLVMQNAISTFVSSIYIDLNEFIIRQTNGTNIGTIDINSASNAVFSFSDSAQNQFGAVLLDNNLARLIAGSGTSPVVPGSLSYIEAQEDNIVMVSQLDATGNAVASWKVEDDIITGSVNGDVYLTIENSGLTAGTNLIISPQGSPVPDSSAALKIQSTSQGLLPPVMTTAQRTGIALPSAGLVVYDTDLNDICLYNGTDWYTLDKTIIP